MSYNGHQGALTPSTKPSVPMNDPPLLSLPPSLPKQSYIPGAIEDEEDVNALDKRDDFNGSGRVRRSSQWGDAPIARSLTNNDHSLLPGSISNGGGIKMGQSPTILSILSGQDNPAGMSYQRNGSMVASSRTYASTTIPQSTQPSTFHQQLPPNPDLYHSTIPDGDEDDTELDGLEDDDLPFDFTLDE